MIERLADEVDRASDLAERERAHLATLRKPVPSLTGKCHWCKENSEQLFCCPECEEDFKRDAWARAQRPKR